MACQEERLSRSCGVPANTASTMAQKGSGWRPSFQSLEGEWNFAYDAQDVGLSSGWNANPVFSKMITVPFCVESEASGIEDLDPPPVVWYAKRFGDALPATPGRTLLHFGAVDYQATVWLNGQYLGRHGGGYTPFSFDVDGLLQDPQQLPLEIRRQFADFIEKQGGAVRYLEASAPSGKGACGSGFSPSAKIRIGWGEECPLLTSRADPGGEFADFLIAVPAIHNDVTGVRQAACASIAVSMNSEAVQVKLSVL